MLHNNIIINQLNKPFRKTDREYIEDYNFNITWSRDRLFDYYSAVDSLLEKRSKSKRLYITRCAPIQIFKENS